MKPHTPHTAKQDARRRLAEAGIPFAKLTARTVSFQDLARISPVFVAIHGATLPRTWKTCFASLPKPSEGGYVPTVGKQCTFTD